MSGRENDHIPMLSDAYPSINSGYAMQRFTGRSASMVIPMSPPYETDESYISHTGSLRGGRAVPLVSMSGPLLRNPAAENRSEDVGGRRQVAIALPPDEMDRRDQTGGGFGASRHANLLMSGPLGLCNDPYCTTCPAAYHAKAAVPMRYFGSTSIESRFHNILHGDAKGWARKSFFLVNSYFPIMHPHAKFAQQWKSFFVISCLVAIFIDPLFFFILSMNEENICIVFNWDFAKAIAAIRSVTDFVYLLHMLLQFRLAYVAPESRVVGAGDFVDDPKKIALRYLRGYFILDLFVVLPLPQVMILVVLPRYIGTSTANYAKNLLRATVLLQYIPRILRFLPLLADQSASGFIFESAWANFVINLLMFVLAGHVVGSCWYLFGLQRVNQCLKDACSSGNEICKKLIDCGSAEEYQYNLTFQSWKNDTNAMNCFQTNQSFNYGIYQQAVLITSEPSIIVRYTYSLFWGFLQISTLAGNQVPSDFVWEVLFTMGINGLGLLLFALLIGNMQNFLQALGRRKLEMQLRRRDVEQWMSHRRLPEELRNHVRDAERFNWAATRGVNEEELLENLPEDLQRNIRRHLFTFLKKVRIFTLMDEPIIDVICERLRQKLYIRGSTVLYKGGPVEKMVFIVRGKMESMGADGNVSPLSEGDVCGEELLTWYLEYSSVNRDGGKIRFPGQRLLSNRTVRCATNVEAFSLRAADLEDVTMLLARFLRNPRVQGAIRYESPYWRTMAATRIQVAWRYRKRRLNRSNGSSSGSCHANSYHGRRY